MAGLHPVFCGELVTGYPCIPLPGNATKGVFRAGGAVSDDLKKLDDDKVFAKLQGHWIIEMSEMLATSNAKSIEEIRSFISRQKETYRTPL